MSERARRRYFALAAARPAAFRNPHPDGIEILLEPRQVRQAERAIAARLEADGAKPQWAEAGLYYEDPWLWVVRDVTRFPDGSFHPYHRIILKGGEHGVVAVPLLNGELVLVEHYRNGIRDWSLEFPRGGPDAGKTSEALARCELAEETGAEVASVQRIGRVSANNGIMTAYLDVCVAELASITGPNRGEGIREVVTVTPSALSSLIRDGRVTDGNTIAAYQLAVLHGHLPMPVDGAGT